MSTETEASPRQLKPSSKADWRKRNDAGPHLAVFPSGAVLKFTIPDEGTLLAAGKLPVELRETAIFCAGHPGGAEGYMRELVVQAMFDAERGQAVTQAIEHGIELGHHLVAAMLVEPAVTAEEVAAGAFPAEDVKMLLEFAERRRNLDAADPPNELPILVAREWARFRAELAGRNGSGDSGGEGPGARADVPEPGDGAV